MYQGGVTLRCHLILSISPKGWEDPVHVVRHQKPKFDLAWRIATSTALCHSKKQTGKINLPMLSSSISIVCSCSFKVTKFYLCQTKGHKAPGFKSKVKEIRKSAVSNVAPEWRKKFSFTNKDFLLRTSKQGFCPTYWPVQQTQTLLGITFTLKATIMCDDRSDWWQVTSDADQHHTLFHYANAYHWQVV